jgi:hypothetical protein
VPVIKAPKSAACAADLAKFQTHQTTSALAALLAWVPTPTRLHVLLVVPTRLPTIRQIGSAATVPMATPTRPMVSAASHAALASIPIVPSTGSALLVLLVLSQIPDLLAATTALLDPRHFTSVTTGAELAPSISTVTVTKPVDFASAALQVTVL